MQQITTAEWLQQKRGEDARRAVAVLGELGFTAAEAMRLAFWRQRIQMRRLQHTAA